MNSEQRQRVHVDAELITPNEILAEGWRVTRAILALRGLEVPDTIEFQLSGAMHIRATRVATLDELAKAIAALDKGQRLNPHEHLEIEQQRDSLVELQKRASQGACPGSTTVIEALFPGVPVKKKTDGERAEIDQWLSIRKEGTKDRP
jgi:hypothetical protein